MIDPVTIAEFDKLRQSLQALQAAVMQLTVYLNPSCSDDRHGPLRNDAHGNRDRRRHVSDTQPAYDDYSSGDEVEDLVRREPSRVDREMHDNSMDYHMVVDLSSFNGQLDIEDFFDWISEVECLFDYIEINEEKKVKLVACKFKGEAFAWWEQLRTTRMRQNKPPIMSWPQMRKLLRIHFLPIDYTQVLFQKYQNCRQGSQSVEEYAAEFYLFVHNDLAETESQQVVRFLGGLRSSIHDRIMFQFIFTLSDAVWMATLVETHLDRLDQVEEDEYAEDQTDDEECPLTYEEEGISSFVQKMSSTPNQSLPLQSYNIFKTRCTINQRVCDLIINQ